jgi:formylglycine-generating enzyme required for sulfatase activity
MELVWVPGGTFTMGCGGVWAGDCEGDEKPARQVEVGGFWMGRTEVTQAQWVAVMGSDPSNHQGCDDCPVEQVSWNDAQGFIARLDPGGVEGLRLPTEAEWEYACRSGGREQTYCGGSDPDRLAWYNGNSGGETHPVGGKTANGLGLYDMSGNVWEWTCSVYANPYDGSEGRCENNKHAKEAPLRAVRGGSWGNGPWFVRAASRYWSRPGDRNVRSGFRLARTLSP